MLSKHDESLLLAFARGELPLDVIAKMRGGQPVQKTLEWLRTDEVATFLAHTRDALDLQATLMASHARIKAIKTLDELVTDAKAPHETRRKAADAAIRITEAIEDRQRADRQDALEAELKTEDLITRRQQRASRESLNRDWSAINSLTTLQGFEEMLTPPPPPTTAPTPPNGRTKAA